MRFDLVEEVGARWRIPPTGAMRVPGIVFASRQLLPDVVEDRSLEQVANVATLPGIVEASDAMPDVHWGYGFPIDGIAATDVARGGVVSPGGVGFDISCGVRLLVSATEREELAPLMPALMDALDREIPRGSAPVASGTSAGGSSTPCSSEARATPSNVGMASRRTSSTARTAGRSAAPSRP
jgi:tRNA-splicing ligase RtcB